MHYKNIDTLRQEAQRQILILRTLLSRAHESGLISAVAESDQSRATFDSESLPKALEVLDGEFHKLSNLEMVLAVVGTMKAGKSTTINAIVGAEVLPNRNRPMTALPTLIRHTPGVLKPQLIFEKVKPLNDLLVDLQGALHSADPNVIDDLQSEPDMKGLIVQIQSNSAFSKRYEGEEGIFHFLKSLNDLVRVCFALDVEFPFAQYATVDAMPVIEVEFTHLKNLPKTQGRLTLLDTPGPNEAGQTHLRHMLKDQLKKASAVLAVLDYTQLKSDADSDVRSNLLAIADTAQDRMYALVNKFDQRNRNSDGPEEVKQYVSQTLMRGVLPLENVFPVSANQGYLASRARNELERNGKLNIDEAWVSDFGGEAIGRRWEQKIDDLEEVRFAANDLWKDSGFENPLDDVIVQAHQNAALEALRSAAAKLQQLIKDTGDFFKANVGALKLSTEKLKDNIENLQQDIENVASIETKIEKSLKNALKVVKKNINKSADSTEKYISESLSAYLAEGEELVKKDIFNKKEKKKNEDNKDRNSLPLAGLGNSISSFFKKRRIDPEEENEANDRNGKTHNLQKIAFSEEKKAIDFKNKIEKSIEKLLTAAEQEIQKHIEIGVSDFSTFLSETKNISLNEIKNSAQRNIDGFDIEIDLPDTSKVSLDSSIGSILSDAVASKTKQVTKNRRKSGAWGTICKWFNTDDWGWESYTSEETYYEIDLASIEDSALTAIQNLFESADDILDSEIYPQLQEGINTFFKAFREKIEHIRGDLIQGMKKHDLQREEKETVLKLSNEMVKTTSALAMDCSVLSECAEKLRRDESLFVVKGEVIA